MVKRMNASSLILNIKRMLNKLVSEVETIKGKANEEEHTP